MSFQKGKPLTQDAFEEASELLGVEAAKLWAVMEVEAKRCGFLEDRRTVILFERHKFHERTGGRFAEHHQISNPQAGGYGRAGAHQHVRLEEAMALDSEAAIWSTSWGLGQVMGFNAERAGFEGQEHMVELMSASEDAQLLGMVRFILSEDLDKSLRTGNWTGFASRYNGRNYRKNQYDERLRGAHQKFSTGPLPDILARECQLLLTYLGYDPGPIDGWFGPSSQRALNSFQRSRGVDETDDDNLDEDVYLLRENAFTQSRAELVA